VKKILVAVTLPLFAIQCAMVANIHSAKTLDPGVSSVSLSVDGAGVMYSFSDSLQKAVPGEYLEPMVIPNATLLPNVNFKMGVKENYELGVLVVPQLLGLEASVKYRFLKSGQNHFAVAPFSSFYLLKNYSAGAHGIYTFEASDAFLLNMSAFSSFTYQDNTEVLSEEVFTSNQFLAFGGVFAPQICGESVFFIPAFEYNIFIPLKENNTLMHIQTYRVSLSFGWYIGKVKQQLNRIENKIDAMDRKIDKNNGNGN